MKSSTSQDFKGAWVKRNSPQFWNYKDAIISVWEQCRSIPIAEQETLITYWKDSDRAIIDTSIWGDICVLKRIPVFTCERIVLNTEGRILQVRGNYPKDLLTFRKISRKVTE